MQIELTSTVENGTFYQKSGFIYKQEKIIDMFLWIEK